MSLLELTGRDLVRALSAAIVARSAVDGAVRARAEEIAAHVAEAGGEARVVRRGHGDYEVESSGLDAPAENGAARAGAPRETPPHW